MCWKHNDSVFSLRTTSALLMKSGITVHGKAGEEWKLSLDSEESGNVSINRSFDKKEKGILCSIKFITIDS